MTLDKLTAAEYAARVADLSPIEVVEKEAAMLKENAPSVREAVNEFWTDFWKELAKRYGRI